ncbi:MAG: YiiX/YebB-like N1pC/P60 family cysteine hydrolase [Planctomycetaceae bacterium]
MLSAQIAADAKTVVDVGRHFQALQARAAQLLATYEASRRGYFTPSEDDETRHLLISYWQSRNALIELLFAFKGGDQLPEELRPAAFLTAFAGALTLIDAARFLRDHFHSRPTVREKLNEPEPHFGIPPGTYDRIQASLTSPVHLWHLYHAVRYFDENEQSLRELARDDNLAAVVETIDRLHHRIQVGVREFTSARVRVNARRAWTTLHRDLFRRALYGLQRAASRLVSDVYTVPDHRPGLPPEVADALRELLQPGDVLITRKDHALTNYFLPGYWPHAALYLGRGEQLIGLGIADHAHVKPRWLRLLECDKQEPRRVLEALKDGVLVRSLTSPFGSDALAVIRPRLREPEIAEALARGLFHEGKPYDFDFDFTRSDRLVCTEVVYRSYEGVGGVRFELTRRAGRMTLAAEDLLQMALDRASFEPLAAYCPRHAANLLIGADAEELIRRTRRGER